MIGIINCYSRIYIVIGDSWYKHCDSCGFSGNNFRSSLRYLRKLFCQASGTGNTKQCCVAMSTHFVGFTLRLLRTIVGIYFNTKVRTDSYRPQNSSVLNPRSEMLGRSPEQPRRRPVSPPTCGGGEFLGKAVTERPHIWHSHAVPS